MRSSHAPSSQISTRQAPKRTPKRELDVITDLLHTELKRESTSVVAIGKLLLEAKDDDKVGRHGQWMDYIEANFSMSQSSAENYMNAARLVAKFPSLGNSKLRRDALYRLGRELHNPSSSFGPKVINAISSEAETTWVNAERAEAIAVSLLQPERPKPSARQLEPERVAPAGTGADAEADTNLEGPAPELTSLKATTDDVIVPFDQAIETLRKLQTKPLEKFVGTTHQPKTFDDVTNFVHKVRNKIHKRKGAAGI
jgi:hypothetical protein